jgi:hypothetical protein
MRIACLILAHKNPLQLKRLIQAMDHPAFDYYIHLDKKTGMEPFRELSKMDRVYFIRKRIKVFWARYSQVQSTLNGIEQIVSGGKFGEYDYLNVMSAQDLPIKPASYIYQYLQAREGREFVTCLRESDQHEWWKDAALHTWRYNFVNWRIPGKYRLEALANRVLPARKYPIAGDEVVGHSSWFTLTVGGARYMLTVLKEHPEIVRFFKYVWGADELIFSTVLYNSVYRDKIEDNLVYVDWSEGAANPKLLTMADYPALIASDKLFARKFDIEKDERIVQQLELRLRENGQG